MTKKQLLKKYAEMIESFEYEGNDGWWIYLKNGYINPHMECGIIHEATLKDVSEQLKCCKKEK